MVTGEACVGGGGGDKDESARREEKESQVEGTKFLPVLSSSVAGDG